ncbi:MAG: hypothetical protein QOJ73_5820 [Streptosporangiaceae bacterium]|nr:hypothetical protein [Streptosporangiaceae bacterium]
MRFCTYCGFALTGAPSYCGGCGAPIDQPLGSESPPAATSPTGAPPVPPPGQGPPDPWGRQTAPDPWPQDPSDPWPYHRPQTAAMTEFLPAVALLGDQARLPPRTPHRPPRPARHGVMILAVLATLVSLAIGGLGAWWISSHHAGLRSTSAGDRSRSPRASSPVAPAPTAASDAVAIAPAVAGEPAAHRVAALLKAYFGSINSRDYSTFSLLFIPEIRGSVDHFNAGYRSTTDSGATLVGLASAGAQDLAATVTFTSRQNPADSPDHATCDRWNVVLTLTSTSTSTSTGAGTGYLIARSPAGYHPTVHACR